MDNVFDFFELRSEEQPIKDLVIHAVDIETTGLDVLAHEIIEIGIARLELNTGEVRPVFTSFVRPVQPIWPHITEITGIIPDDLKDAPPVEQLGHRIASLLSGSLTIAHNAEFDFSFLRKFFGSEFICDNDIAVIDTLKLSRQWINSPKYSLGFLTDYLKLPQERAHRATDDAVMCLRLFYHILKTQPQLLDMNPMEIEATYGRNTGRIL
jgi:DNA polymerase III epsilon subunit family exonuclease